MLKVAVCVLCLICGARCAAADCNHSTLVGAVIDLGDNARFHDCRVNGSTDVRGGFLLVTSSYVEGNLSIRLGISALTYYNTTLINFAVIVIDPLPGSYLIISGCVVNRTTIPSRGAFVYFEGNPTSFSITVVNTVMNFTVAFPTVLMERSTIDALTISMSNATVYAAPTSGDFEFWASRAAHLTLTSSSVSIAASAFIVGAARALIFSFAALSMTNTKIKMTGTRLVVTKNAANASVVFGNNVSSASQVGLFASNITVDDCRMSLSAAVTVPLFNALFVGGESSFIAMTSNVMGGGGANGMVVGTSSVSLVLGCTKFYGRLLQRAVDFQSVGFVLPSTPATLRVDGCSLTASPSPTPSLLGERTASRSSTKMGSASFSMTALETRSAKSLTQANTRSTSITLTEKGTRSDSGSITATTTASATTTQSPTLTATVTDTQSSSIGTATPTKNTTLTATHTQSTTQTNSKSSSRTRTETQTFSTGTPTDAKNTTTLTMRQTPTATESGTRTEAITFTLRGRFSPSNTASLTPTASQSLTATTARSPSVSRGSTRTAAVAATATATASVTWGGTATARVTATRTCGAVVGPGCAVGVTEGDVRRGVAAMVVERNETAMDGDGDVDEGGVLMVNATMSVWDGEVDRSGARDLVVRLGWNRTVCVVSIAAAPWFSVSGTLTLSATVPVRSACRDSPTALVGARIVVAPTPSALTAAVTGAVEATAVALTVLGSSASAANMQALAVAGLMSCTDAYSRKVLGSYRVLSPFALGNSLKGVLLGNAAVVGGVFVLHSAAVGVVMRLGKTAGDAAGLLRYPGLSVVAALATHQGTAFAGAQLATGAEGDLGRGIGALALLWCVALPAMLLVGSWRYVSRSYAAFDVDSVAAAGRPLPAALVRFIAPEGGLRTINVSRSFGFLLRRRFGHVYVLFPFVPPTIVLVSALFSPSGGTACVALYGGIAGSYYVFAGVVFVVSPLNNRLSETFGIVGLVLVGTVFALNGAAAGMEPPQRASLNPWLSAASLMLSGLTGLRVLQMLIGAVLSHRIDRENSTVVWTYQCVVDRPVVTKETSWEVPLQEVVDDKPTGGVQRTAKSADDDVRELLDYLDAIDNEAL